MLETIATAAMVVGTMTAITGWRIKARLARALYAEVAALKVKADKYDRMTRGLVQNRGKAA